MVYEARKQSMAWMETDYSKDTHFRLKVKWRLEHLGALGIATSPHCLSIRIACFTKSDNISPIYRRSKFVTKRHVLFLDECINDYSRSVCALQGTLAQTGICDAHNNRVLLCSKLLSPL